MKNKVSLSGFQIAVGFVVLMAVVGLIGSVVLISKGLNEGDTGTSHTVDASPKRSTAPPVLPPRKEKTQKTEKPSVPAKPVSVKPERVSPKSPTTSSPKYSLKVNLQSSNYVKVKRDWPNSLFVKFINFDEAKQILEIELLEEKDGFKKGQRLHVFPRDLESEYLRKYFSQTN